MSILINQSAQTDKQSDKLAVHKTHYLSLKVKRSIDGKPDSPLNILHSTTTGCRSFWL